MKPVAILRHAHREGPGYLATFLDRHCIPWQLIPIDDGAPVPADAFSFSGLALMGGPMSVNDPLPWIGEELALIRDCRAGDIPVIGHCLGGQLMAKAFGASVVKNPVKEIGWGTVRVVESAVTGAWFGEFRDFAAFHWHGETFGLPADATHILSSPHCAHQAFAVGPHVAMQCHIEMTESMIVAWCESGAAEIAACASSSVQSAAQIQADIDRRLAVLGAVAECVYTHWINGLRRR